MSAPDDWTAARTERRRLAEMGKPAKRAFTIVLDVSDYERLSALAKRDGYKTAQLARLIIERAVRRKDVKK